MNKSDLLLRVENLEVAYENKGLLYKAVKGVSFDLFCHESVALVGESGCGKSALVQSIVQLQKQNARILRGKACFLGLDLLQLSAKDLRFVRGKKIGLIFQGSSSSLDPTMKVGRQIQEVFFCHEKIDRRAAFEKTLHLMQAVGIQDALFRIDHYPHQFSGGMRQRIAIAMAIAAEPSLLLSDEPTTALDVTVQAQIIELLQQIQARMGMTVFLITHDLGVVAQMCHRMLVMYAGKIVESGPCREIFSAPQHPYTYALMQAVPQMQGCTKQRAKVLPDSAFATIPTKGCPYFTRCPYAMKVCRTQMPSLMPTGERSAAACWLLAPGAERQAQIFKKDKDG